MLYHLCISWGDVDATVSVEHVSGSWDQSASQDRLGDSAGQNRNL